MGWRWVGAMACVAMSASASAAVLCKTSSGLVAVRDVCNQGETELDPVVLGLQGPPGRQGLYLLVVAIAIAMLVWSILTRLKDVQQQLREVAEEKIDEMSGKLDDIQQAVESGTG